jgi:GTPase SAR1 family protein
MKNVLPPVIESLLTEARRACNLDYPRLIKAIEAVEQYKKQLEQEEKKSDTITLTFRSSGDRQVGVSPQFLDITMWSGYVAPNESLRKQIVELFKSDVEELFDEPAAASWSDESERWLLLDETKLG